MLVNAFIFHTSYRTYNGEKPENDQYLAFFYPLSDISKLAEKIYGSSYDPEILAQKMVYKVVSYVWYFIKIILVLLYVYTVAILNLTAEEFSFSNTVKLYIADNIVTQSQPPSVPEKSNSFLMKMSSAFSNLNLNYLMHYN